MHSRSVEDGYVANAAALAVEPGTLEIFLLGPWEVRVDGAPVPPPRWTRRASRQLVKMLAVSSSRRFHREQIMDALWPDSGFESAANSLHKTIHAARRALEPGLAAGGDSRFLKTTASEVWLAAPAKLWVDAEAFAGRVERAIEAKSVEACAFAKELYRGDLLAEDLYEPWASDARERLRGLYAELLKCSSVAFDRRGDLRHAVRELTSLLALEPADEEAHRGLMSLFTRLGARERAYEQFDRCRAALREHYGVGPDRKTTELYERILSGAIAPEASLDDAGEPETARDDAPKGRRRADAPPARTAPAAAPANNLPRQVTGFVGRETQVAEAAALVRRNPLLTVAGPGGVGKTRFALEVASAVCNDFRDAVWLVELWPLHDGAHVARTIAATLGLREEPGRRVDESIVDYLRSRNALLVLDGGEHLVATCAELVAALLSRCSEVCVLFTSREALDLPGEIVWRLPPLATPATPPATARAAVAFESVRLLVDRARHGNPAFRLTDETAAAAGELCARLEGLPLAIELVAARLAVLSPEQALDRLEGAMQILDIDARGTPARHATIRVTLDWSYSLCSEVDRAALRALSLFSGTWGLEAAEALCAPILDDPETAIEAIARLVRKSLVLAVDSAAEVRYRMPTTVRLYAREKLAERDEVAATKARLGAWYRDLALSAERELRGPKQEHWLDVLATEHETMRAVLRDPAMSGGGLAAAEICIALMRYFTVRGHWSEGGLFLESALADAGPLEPSTVRARAYYAAGTLARLRSDAAYARASLERSLEDFRALGDSAGVASAYYNLSTVALSLQDIPAAEALGREALALYTDAGDEFGRALVQIQLANVSSDRGDRRAARAYLFDSLGYFRRAGDKLNTGIVLHSLGELAQSEGELDAAAAYFEESISMTERIGYLLLRSLSEAGLGFIALARGATDDALRRFAESFSIGLELNDTETILNAGEGLAAITIHRGDPRVGVVVRDAAANLRAEQQVHANETYSAVLAPWYARAVREMNSRELLQAQSRGAVLTFEAFKEELDRQLTKGVLATPRARSGER